MRAFVQRVQSASVTIDGKQISQINKGFLVLIGIETGDTTDDLKYISSKVMNLRVFEDEHQKMNLALKDVEGSILAVSQFTLLGDARSSRRPSFITAARPAEAIPLYEQLIQSWRNEQIPVQTGVFGADMKVELINDGPVTILLDSKKIL